MEVIAAARTIPYRATAKRTNDAIKAAYLQELKGNPLPSQILGLDVDALSVRIGKKLWREGKNLSGFLYKLGIF